MFNRTTRSRKIGDRFHNVYATHSREESQSGSLECIPYTKFSIKYTFAESLLQNVFYCSMKQQGVNVQQNKDNTSLLFWGVGGDYKSHHALTLSIRVIYGVFA